MNKLEALAEFLDVNINAYEEGPYLDDIISQNGNEFTYEGKDYLVLTDKEADERVAEYIKDSLWAFNADFLWPFIKACDALSHEETIAFTRMISSAQQNSCEGCNAMLLGLVGDRLDDLIADAVSADGRGHFLATYDSYEQEQDGYFIYRTN